MNNRFSDNVKTNLTICLSVEGKQELIFKLDLARPKNISLSYREDACMQRS